MNSERNTVPTFSLLLPLHFSLLYFTHPVSYSSRSTSALWIPENLARVLDLCPEIASAAQSRLQTQSSTPPPPLTSALSSHRLRRPPPAALASPPLSSTRLRPSRFHLPSPNRASASAFDLSCTRDISASRVPRPNRTLASAFRRPRLRLTFHPS